MRKTVTAGIISILLIFISIACSPSPYDLDPQEVRIHYEKELKERLSNVDISDGIDREEALAISDNYYHRFTYSGCGGPGQLLETADTWRRVVHIGYRGEPIEEKIVIDKKAGKVSWKHGPTLDDPHTMWQ